MGDLAVFVLRGGPSRTRLHAGVEGGLARAGVDADACAQEQAEAQLPRASSSRGTDQPVPVGRIGPGLAFHLDERIVGGM